MPSPSKATCTDQAREQSGRSLFTPDGHKLNVASAVKDFAAFPSLPTGQAGHLQHEATPTLLHDKRFGTDRSFLMLKGPEDQRSFWDAAAGECVLEARPPTGKCDSSLDARGWGGGFHVRPEAWTRHGRQSVKTLDNNEVKMSVAKRSKLTGPSVWGSDCFDIAAGDGKRDTILSCEFVETKSECFDIMAYCDIAAGDGKPDPRKPRESVNVVSVGRCMHFRLPASSKGVMAALAWKPRKIPRSAGAECSLRELGYDCELQVDVAAGEDCSFILAALLGVLQVCDRLGVDASMQQYPTMTAGPWRKPHGKSRGKSRDKSRGKIDGDACCSGCDIAGCCCDIAGCCDGCEL